MWPSKEQRMKNRKQAKERQHWSTIIIISIGVVMNNGFIIENNHSIILLYTIVGVLTGAIPLLSIWRARNSKESRRRLATKDASELAFTTGVILSTSIFIGLFHASVQLTLDRLIAGIIAVGFWMVFGVVSRSVYKKLLNVQDASASEDKQTTLTSKKNLMTAGSVYVVAIFIMFYWIF